MKRKREGRSRGKPQGCKREGTLKLTGKKRENRERERESRKTLLATQNAKQKKTKIAAEKRDARNRQKREERTLLAWGAFPPRE